MSSSVAALVPADTPQRIGLLARLDGVYRAWQGLAYLLAYGAIGAMKAHLGRFMGGRGALLTLDLHAWRSAITANGLPILLEGSDEGNAPFKHHLIFPNARGRVLEIGAGTGMTLKYYDPSVVSEVFAVEPYKELHGMLRESVAALPQLADKVHILSSDIEDVAALNSVGVSAGSIDTVCLVQVLCSVRDPVQHVQQLSPYLKRGGQVLLFEHVRSSDTITGYLQRAFQPFWTSLAGNCHLTRDPITFFNADGWHIKQYDRPAAEVGGGGLFPHLIARLVKS